MRNPVALTAKPVQELFKRAFEKATFGDAIGAILWAANNTSDDDVLILLARDDAGNFKGLTMVVGGTDVFSPVPFLLYFYSEGGRAVTDALSSRLDEWILSLGHTCFRCLNTTGRSDEAHMMYFSPSGLGKVVCSMIEYQIPPKE